MRHAIVEKLRNILLEPADSEYKVLYVLAQTRKLLDQVPREPAPFALHLYCHWALHTDLHAYLTTKNFMERVDGYAASVLAGTPSLVSRMR